MTRFLLVLSLAAAVPAAAAADDAFVLQDGQRVVFLGDSNTFAGRFIVDLDAYLVTRFPDKKFELLNLGLPSETASGLSEPDHPYPRPDVHERLDRVLAKTKPDVVVVCCGMNDGIYYPFSEERFAKYKDGMRRLIDKGTKAGAKVVVLTPAPFDPAPLKDKVQPKTADKFSWVKPYEGYDDVLGRYSDWLLTLRDKDLPVVDAHAALSRALAETRKTQPDFHFAGDGVHFDANGHRLVALELLRAWNAPKDVDAAEIDAKTAKVQRGQVGDLSVEKGVVRFNWLTKLPAPGDPTADARLAEKEDAGDRFNRHRLTITGTDAERYELFEGDKSVGKVSAKQLTAGVDLLSFPDLTTNRRAAEVWKLVEERQKLLGLAWLTDAGHKRPDTPKGVPLEEAQRRAADLDAQIRKLARPVKLELRLVPDRG